MAYAALDYWHNGLAVPEDGTLPVDGTLLSTLPYSCRRLDHARMWTALLTNFPVLELRRS
jgi:hypothetical protein